MGKKTVRLAIKEDRDNWFRWLNDPKILKWFPICSDTREIEDTVRIWETYIPMQAILTVMEDDKICGMANLYIQSFEKLKHQCLFAIILDPDFRGRGIGTFLMEELEKLAKEKFHIEQLHLEVYKGNPAKRLYDRLDFEEYGRQKHFLKENNEYIDKIFMRKFLI